MQKMMHNGTSADSFAVQWKGSVYQIYISLPIRYDSGNKQYPILVVLDANLLFGAASDIARMLSLGRTLVPDGVEMPISMPPEMIVVGIGYPAEDPQSVTIESSKRRMYDFTHLADNLGPEGERLRQPLLHYYPEGIPYGGAADFLDMIQGPLAEELGQRYRINPGCSILFGASAGATFATYVLLERPSAFSHYIVASPSLYLCGEDLFQKEASYAADNSDLAANVFISFGARELDLFAQAAIASSATRLAELLTRRNYPGLVLKTAIFQDETHARACLSGLARGLDHLFGAS